MPTHHDGQPSAKRTRQLTIGECLAVARYGPSCADPDTGAIDYEQLLMFMDGIRVCTTCGWSAALHEGNPKGVSSMHICAQFTREF